MSALLSLFSTRQAQQPTFVNPFPAKPTEVYVTQDTTTRVDPPPAQPRLSFTAKLRRASRASAAKPQPNNGSVPNTPRAPSAFRTTFTLLSPRRASVSAAASQWPKDKGVDDKYDYDLSAAGGPAPLPTLERVVYIEREPRILTRTFFFLGILFPIFWIIGAIALLRPLSSEMPDPEQGQLPSGIIARKVSSDLRAAETRWARFCLAALFIEIILVLLIVGTATWGMKLFTKQSA